MSDCTLTNILSAGTVLFKQVIWFFFDCTDSVIIFMLYYSYLPITQFLLLV